MPNDPAIPAAPVADAATETVERDEPIAPRLHNTLGRRLETFEPVHPGEVRLYACGPTVYDHVHIGNLRTFVFGDLLARSLRFLGWRVTQVMNLTDVDDKILAGAAAAGKELDGFTAPYIDSFFTSLDVLNVERAEGYPRATEHIPRMLALVETLVERGYAYEADGSVFFRIAADPDYGKLSGRDLSQMRPGERVAADEYDKEDARDFVLWKAAKPGEPSWDSPWGRGRPGWHLECSVMASEYLGQPIDLHVGGVDLVFPHHENEIAQSESAAGEPFVRCWLHAEHLIVDGQKMSKSLGNQYTLPDLLERGVEPRALRYLFLSVHYRQKLNFTFRSLDAARSALARLDEMRFRLGHAAEEGEADPEVAELARRLEEGFAEALADDLSIARGLAVLFDFVRDANRRIEAGPLGEGDRERLEAVLASVDRVLGVLDPSVWEVEEEEGDGADDDAEIERLVAERQAARERRDFAEADRLRDELAERDVVVEDTPQGPRWKRR